MMGEFGLSEECIQVISKEIAKFPEIKEAYIYGSRAMGNYKKGSDIDISIKGENITHQIELTLRQRLENDNVLPYFFDVTHYNSLTNDNLKEHIDEYGIRFYPSQLRPNDCSQPR